jgi:WD40 repeat protein
MFKTLPDRPADAVTVMPLPADENFAHWGEVGSIRFADDGGQIISVGARDGMIKRWGWREDDLLTMQQGLIAWDVSAGAISSDGRYAAMQQLEDIPVDDSKEYDYGAVTRIWEMATGEQIGVVRTAITDGGLVAVGPAGKRVLLADEVADDEWRMIDVASGEVLWERRMDIGQWPRPAVVAFTPDGELIAIDTFEITDLDEYERRRVADEDLAPVVGRHVALLDASTGNVRRMIDVKIDGEIPEVLLDPSGQWVLAAYEDQTVITWSLATGNRLYEFGSEGLGTVMALSAGGRHMVTVDDESLLAVWDLAEAKCVMAGELDSFIGLASSHVAMISRGESALPNGWQMGISADGALLATGDMDGKMQVWEVASGAELAALPADPRHIQALAISRDGSMAYIVRTDGGAHLLDTTSGEWHDANGVEFRVTCAAMLTNHASVVGGYNGELAITETLTRLEQSPVHMPQMLSEGDGVAISALAVSDDGRYLATANMDGRVQLWEMTSRELIWERAFGGYVSSLAFGDGLGARSAKDWNDPGAWVQRDCGPGADMLAAAGGQGIVVWDVLDGVPLSVQPEVYAVELAFSSDGESVFTVNSGKIVEIDWRTGKEVKVYDELQTWLWGGHVSRMALCPTSNRLYVLESGGFLGLGTELKLGVIDLSRNRSLMAARGVRLESAGQGAPEANNKFVDYFGMPVYVSPSGVVIETGRFGVVNIWRLGVEGE